MNETIGYSKWKQKEMSHAKCRISYTVGSEDYHCCCIQHLNVPYAWRLAPFYTLVVLNRIMWRGHFIDLPHILLFTFLSAQIIFSMSMFIIVFLSYILILSMVLTIFRPPRFYPSSSLYSCPMSMFVPVLMSTSWFFLIIARWFSTSLWELHKLSSL